MENENYDLTLAYATNDFPIVEILLGEMHGTQDIENLDLNSLTSNSGVVTSSVTLLSNHPSFEGTVFQVNFAGETFWRTYGNLWGETSELFTLEGTFSDGQSFSTVGLILLDGFLSGDANLDGKVNVLDLTFLVDYIFRGGSEPIVPETADMDRSCDPLPNINDLTWIVGYIFRGTFAPMRCEG